MREIFWRVQDIHLTDSLMLNKIFGWENGKLYKMSWIPLIYHVAMQGTIFNQANIVANSLSSCAAAAQGGLTQRKSEFYMGSYLIDCILCLHQFPKLNCDWDHTKAPVYAAYNILWDHKYASYYKMICEEFIMPLQQLIFLE